MRGEGTGDAALVIANTAVFSVPGSISVGRWPSSNASRRRVKDDVCVATPPLAGVASGAPGSFWPKPPNSARPASCSACHFAVRTQRLR